MAVVRMQKINLFGLRKHRDALLNFLQEKEVMQVEEITEEESEEKTPETAWQKEKIAGHDLELKTANLEFAVKFLKPYEKKRSFLAGRLMLTPEKAKERAKSANSSKLVEKCRELEEKYVALENNIHNLEQEKEILEPFKNFDFKLDNPRETDRIKIFIGSSTKEDYSKIKEKLAQFKLLSLDKIKSTENAVYFTIIAVKEIEREAKEILNKYKFQEAELPQTDKTPEKELENINKKIAEAEKELKETKKDIEETAKHTENLQIAHDYYVWQRDKEEAARKLKNSNFSFAASGWIPKALLPQIQKEAEEISKEVEITATEPEKGEKTPTVIKNSNFMRPFETVTKIYGLPMASEVDPTPFLAAFFIIFFGLCLTDAGYGILLFALTFAALKFLKIPKESQGLIKLIMYGGLVTFVLGIIFGGWFGMDPSSAPAFMTKEIIGEGGEVTKMFKWQLISQTTGNGPLTFLIIAMILGITHVCFGILIDGYWKLKNKQYLDAILDSFLWLAFIISILLFALSKMGIFLSEASGIFGKAVIVGVILMVLTQGRQHKNILLKLGAGILSLYGLVGYMSDVLSYSRLMALGLGTGVIGFAMNTLAGVIGDLIPYVGFLLAIPIIILGHTLNIGISALGAFIHSGRLQFVEFFSKFLEGGGAEFKPLRRKCKYIAIARNK